MIIHAACFGETVLRPGVPILQIRVSAAKTAVAFGSAQAEGDALAMIARCKRLAARIVSDG